MQKIKVEKLFHYEGHTNAIYSLTSGRTKDTVISAGGDGRIVEWNLKSQQVPLLLAQLGSQIFACQYIPASKLLIAGQLQGGIHVMDLKLKKEIKFLTLHKKAIFQFHHLPEKNAILAISGDGSLSVWASGDLSLLLHQNISRNSLRTLAIHPQTGEMAIGCSDNYIHLLDEKMQVKDQFKAHDNSIFSLAYSPDGKFLVSGSRDAYLKIWNVEKNYEICHSIPAHGFTINDMAFHPEGDIFATAGRDKEIRIWNIRSFELLKVINKEKNEGHSHSVNKLMWKGPLVSGGDDRKLMVWDIKIEKN